MLVADVTRRLEFCLNYSLHHPMVTVEGIQLFEAEMAATIETLFLSVTEPLLIIPKASGANPLSVFVGNPILLNAEILVMSLVPGEFRDPL